ncbi:MAG: DODA-type extradiol aromatic ring-opening family dioxygenase [Deefgea sp.]
MPHTLFISHGAPSLVIDDVPARDFLLSLGKTLPRPKLIVMISAHNIQAQTTVGIAPQWQEWHDFGGFSPELYEMQYRPQGDSDFAQRLAQQLANTGLTVAITDDPALDHGAWVPLKLMYPNADVPVVTISLAQNMDAAAHWALGERLAEILPDDVLLIGSGSITHNLRDAFGRMQSGQTEFEIELYAAEFIAATYSALDTYTPSDWENWQNNLPHARRAHPTPEHFLPLLIAKAAAGQSAHHKALHQSMSLGVLGMDVIAFESTK